VQLELPQQILILRRVFRIISLSRLLGCAPKLFACYLP